MGGIIFVLIVAAFFVVLFIGITIKRVLIVVPPSEALILSGGRRKVGDRVVGYRVVRGGSALRLPLLERADRIDLRNIKIDVQVMGAYSKGGIPLNVQGVANVKLPGGEPLLTNAVERFLGRTREEIMLIAKETLEGNLRGVLAQLTPEEVNEDKNRFAQMLVEEAEHDMARMGLELDLLKIQNVTDDVGYLKSIGRIAGADLRKRAVSAEVSAQAEAAVQKAQNWQASETARYDADLAISRSDMDKRIIDARTKREAMIQEARGQVFAQIAQVRAEIERQKARAIQVQRKLEADVVQPAEAARQKKEEEARGAAASILERGKAEALALKKLVEAYKAKGGDAREILALQSVLPMALDISGARFPLKIGKVTVLPGGGDSLAKGLIGANEQLKSASGIDLGSMASRLMPPKPPAK
ncbi:MAG: flotillin family protein [Deltaproteobacteria bacterium]|nr:flotillin family protein [Deltaproteobacteria bacterium]